MSRVLISADMEGASGLTASHEVEVGGLAWSEMRRLLTADVNAAITGFFEAGATEVLVAEAHASARNLVIDLLDDRVTVFRGRPTRLGMMEGLDRSVDAVAFVGYHAGAGTAGVLSHTFLASGLLSVRLNGEEASEGRLNAALAAEYGAAVILVTGDDRACADSEEWAPGALRVAVKRATGRFSAECMTPAASSQAIRAAAHKALEVLPPVLPTRVAPAIDVEFTTAGVADSVSAIPSVVVTGPRSVQFRVDSVEAAYRCLWVVLTVARQAMDSTYG